MIDQLCERLHEHDIQARQAVIEHDRQFSYQELVQTIAYYETVLEEYRIGCGHAVILYGNFSFHNIALFLALARRKTIIAPITHSDFAEETIAQIVGIDFFLKLDESNHLCIQSESYQKPALLAQFLQEQQPGLVFFSSGSSGEPKATLHNLNRLLRKYVQARKAFVTLAFLLFDHIAGIDTLFYTLFAGGTLVIPPARDPFTILQTIEKHNVEVFATSPSFLNFLLATQNVADFQLSSLKVITFGSERMYASTLQHLRRAFDSQVKLIQKYGTTEFGSPISKSRSEDPLWLKFDRNTSDYRVVNGRLLVKSATSMIGYLNAEDPFMEDGWIDTGDMVEMDGDWIKILGRETDMINVGGQKVYPAEVESVLLELDNITDVAVYALLNPLMGQIVAAKINLVHEESISSLKRRIREYCRNKLEPFKIPAHIEITTASQVSERFKKVRS